MCVMIGSAARAKYQKGPGVGYVGGAGALSGCGRLRLRITLGDMPLDDALEAMLDDADFGQSLGSLLEGLFEDGWVPSDADLARNPDLPDMLDELAAILRSSREGRSALGFYVNHGAEAQLDSVVGGMCRAESASCGGLEAVLLDLVIEQRFTPLAYSVGLGYWKSRDELRERLEGQALLVFAGSGEAASNIETSRLHILRGEGLLDDSHGLTAAGIAALDAMRASSSSLGRRYDVFADVCLDEESGIVEVGTGRGEDMRPQVYEEESLDPVSTAFEVTALEHVVEWIDDWASSEDPAEFFDRLLAWTVEPEPLDEAVLDHVIEAGFTHLEEMEEGAEAAGRARMAVRRSRRLPREPVSPT